MPARWIPLGLFALLLAALGWGLTREPTAIAAPTLDRPLPETNLPAFSSPDATLGTAEVAALAGGGAVLLNVWGSWCAACVTEHPVLTRIAEEEGVPLVGLNWRDTRLAGRAWLERHGDPYSLVLFDADSEWILELGVTGAPETFVVDGSGRIRHHHVGPVSERDWQLEIGPVVRGLQAASEALPQSG